MTGDPENTIRRLVTDLLLLLAPDPAPGDPDADLLADAINAALDVLVSERAQLREALDFYANNSTYIEGLPPLGSFDGPTPIHLDSGRRARAALSAGPGADA